MRIWLVLAIRNEQIGNKTKNTQEYEQYLSEKAQLDREREGGGWVFGSVSEPTVKTEQVPYMFNIPRIVDVCFEDPTEKYKDRLPSGKDWVYKRDLVWIEELDVEDGKVLESFKYTFNV